MDFSWLSNAFSWLTGNLGNLSSVLNIGMKIWNVTQGLKGAEGQKRAGEQYIAAQRPPSTYAMYPGASEEMKAYMPPGITGWMERGDPGISRDLMLAEYLTSGGAAYTPEQISDWYARGYDPAIQEVLGYVPEWSQEIARAIGPRTVYHGQAGAVAAGELTNRLKEMLAPLVSAKAQGQAQAMEVSARLQNELMDRKAALLQAMQAGELKWNEYLMETQKAEMEYAKGMSQLALGARQMGKMEGWSPGEAGLEAYSQAGKNPWGSINMEQWAKLAGQGYDWLKGLFGDDTGRPKVDLEAAMDPVLPDVSADVCPDDEWG